MIRSLIAGVLLLASPLRAEELQILNFPDKTVILLTGEIIQDTAQRLDELLTANPTITKVGMVSGGGLANEGFNLASVLSNHNVTAIVPKGYACLSACAIGFIGAKEYVVLGAIGFHNMYINDENLVEADKLSLLLSGQRFGVRTAIFFVANGFELELPYVISVLTSPEEFIIFGSTEDLLTFFARTEEDNVVDYLATNDIDEAWIEAHLFDSSRLAWYLRGDENNAR